MVGLWLVVGAGLYVWQWWRSWCPGCRRAFSRVLTTPDLPEGAEALAGRPYMAVCLACGFFWSVTRPRCRPSRLAAALSSAVVSGAVAAAVTCLLARGCAPVRGVGETTTPPPGLGVAVLRGRGPRSSPRDLRLGNLTAVIQLCVDRRSGPTSMAKSQSRSIRLLARSPARAPWANGFLCVRASVAA